MAQTQQKIRIAFVYPPYGPPTLASLGLAILSAGVKARGFECRTFYWNYHVEEALPHATYAQKRKTYALLTERAFSPWNEWAFTRSIFPNELGRRDGEALTQLATLDAALAGQTGEFWPSQIVLYLANHAVRLVTEMAERLVPFDVIGISTTFFQNGPALALAKRVKERWPEKTIVLGGANCDGEMGRGLIEKFPFLDCVFSGEVDQSFPEFVECLAADTSIGHVPGLLYRTPDGRVLEGPPAVPIANLNQLPIPDFDDYISERKRFGQHVEGEICLPLESSRGCWWGAKHHCVFCGLNANGMAYRQKDPERFKDEVQTIVDRYGARYLFMADNILSATYYKDFVQWAKQRRLNVDFFYEIKANVTRQQVSDLAEAGITMVQPGIESFSSKILRLMQKGVRGIQNIAFLKYAAEYGIVVAYNLLAGFPGEDPFEYERLAREIPKLSHFQPPNGVMDIEFHRFSPYHNDTKRFGIRLHPHENYSFIYPFAEEDLARLAYFFELEGRSPADLSYLSHIRGVVLEWRSHYDGEECALTWRRDGRDILIKDRRRRFGPRDYRLQDHAVAVFEALDTPTGLQTTVQRSLENAVNVAASIGHEAPERASSMPSSRVPLGHAPILHYNWPWPTSHAAMNISEKVIAFTDAQFRRDPAAYLEQLISAGIVYSDDGLYLGLPVCENYRRTQAAWARMRI
jgi:ribosomal peptide maturation radical SAM protein 1